MWFPQNWNIKTLNWLIITIRLVAFWNAKWIFNIFFFTKIRLRYVIIYVDSCNFGISNKIIEFQLESLLFSNWKNYTKQFSVVFFLYINYKSKWNILSKQNVFSGE